MSTKVSAWSKIEVAKTECSLEDVMSEQLANELNEKEFKKINLENDNLIITPITPFNSISENNSEIINQSTQDDYILANLLQLEYDKEYDQTLKLYENQRNKNSRVSMSYDNFKIVHPVLEKDEKELDARNSDNVEVVESSDSDEELLKTTFKNGVHGKGENMISKHDLELCGKRNASRVMNFPPEFETGDGHGFNMCLPNSVFNVLKVHSVHEAKRKNRLHDKKEKATTELVLDSKTRLILYKFVNSDILDSIGGVISTGKEASVLYAAGGKSKEVLMPKECAIKVYKTTLNEFKTRSKYIKDDYRFKNRYKHLNPRKIVKLWAEKEMHNLMKIRNYGILCPEVIELKKHVLVMSFIGRDEKAAPKLKDVNFTEEQLKSAYEQCVQIIKDLYNLCNLVHADFSEYNLLWHEERVWVIDVSQSIENLDPMSLEFLIRDCKNLSNFFSTRNYPDVESPESLFNKVTNQKFNGEGSEFLSQIQKYIKEKQLETPVKDAQQYNFDYYFEKSLKDKNNANKSSSSSSEYEDEENEN